MRRATALTAFALALVAALAATPAAAQYNLRSPPGFYPGDRDGWQQIGWGNDGRFRYSCNGRLGYWTAGCFGCGTWRLDNPYSGFQECPPCNIWVDGKGCLTVPSGACTTNGIPAWCGTCQYWTPSSGCVNADGCGVTAVAGASTSGGGTVIYTSNNGGGVATSSGNGAAWVGNGAAAASSGGAGAWAGPGGASAWPGK